MGHKDMSKARLSKYKMINVMGVVKNHLSNYNFKIY